MKRTVRIAATLVASVLVSGAVGCVQDPGSAEGVATTTSDERPRVVVPAGALPVEYSDTDLDARVDASAASQIIFSDGSPRIEGTGASAKGGVVTISSAGTYFVTGATAEGQIVIDLDSDDVVKLVLNGVDVSSFVGPPIVVENADKVLITLSKGTVNTVACGAPDLAGEADPSRPDAAIFSRSDLTINGTGTLRVTSAHNHGIVSKDDLKIVEGTVSVESAKEGIKGRDCVGVRAGTVTVDAGGDGLQSNNDEDSARGQVVIEGGTLDITAVQDGIQAANTLLVLGGAISLKTGGGSDALIQTDPPSAQGLKSDIGIYVVGGMIDIDSSDDAVNSNGLVRIDGGTLKAASGDDGVHADDFIEVNGGTVDIVKSFEGLESALITINDGIVRAVATDDALNAVTIRVEVILADRPGQKFSNVPDGSEVHINGGYVTLDGTGDGLDSNGGIFMTGGTVIVNGPSEGMNVAVDYNSEFIMTGGLLVAAGASRLAEAPGASSTQNSILVKFDSLQDAGSLVHVASADGEEIMTFRPLRQYQAFVLSSPDLKEGFTYDIYVGGTSTGTEVDGVFDGGSYSGGTKYTSLTISGALTTSGGSGGPGAGHP